MVELFYATGEYADVVVETTPAAGGVEVVFRPVKAPLLAEVRVEGDRLVKAEAARRMARLRPREPLWPARLEQAARDIALALAQRGYLEARVSESIRPTAARRGRRLHHHRRPSGARGRRRAWRARPR